MYASDNPELFRLYQTIVPSLAAATGAQLLARNVALALAVASAVL
jgi:hypothetical protein